mmetsp:Transcript_25224/g.72828  ORF Transcript_25224/g.72828 Transcript_25224/m.72828 type:complete len:206 (+) Transcript_25224:878-1495(+)
MVHARLSSAHISYGHHRVAALEVNLIDLFEHLSRQVGVAIDALLELLDGCGSEDGAGVEEARLGEAHRQLRHRQPVLAGQGHVLVHSLECCIAVVASLELWKQRVSALGWFVCSVVFAGQTAARQQAIVHSGYVVVAGAARLSQLILKRSVDERVVVLNAHRLPQTMPLSQLTELGQTKRGLVRTAHTQMVHTHTGSDECHTQES